MGLRQHNVPMGLDTLRLAREHLLRGQGVQAAMPMAGVMPGNELSAKSPGLIERSKAFRIRHATLEGRKQAFNEGVIDLIWLNFRTGSNL